MFCNQLYFSMLVLMYGAGIFFFFGWLVFGFYIIVLVGGALLSIVVPVLGTFVGVLVSALPYAVGCCGAILGFALLLFLLGLVVGALYVFSCYILPNLLNMPASAVLPSPQIPLPFGSLPNLPGIDWSKFWKCLLSAMPSTCGGDVGPELPKPKDPKEVLGFLLGLIEKGREMIEEEKQKWEKTAREVGIAVERAGEAATTEMHNLFEDAKDEAKKLDKVGNEVDAALGTIRSHLPSL
jgi:hypothetical protein